MFCHKLFHVPHHGPGEHWREDTGGHIHPLLSCLFIFGQDILVLHGHLKVIFMRMMSFKPE